MGFSGQFAVSERGAATYTIPIRVAPGIAGMEPNLSLVYSSQTGNGLLGVGWSIAGLSAITRCPRTAAQDGARGGIKFDANDRFCLDGQRLMVVSGTYGAVGAEYRTESDVFAKVVSVGGTAGDPASFTVRTKSGQIVEYGNTADSRIEAQGKSAALVWAVNRIADTKGNFISYSYIEDSANGEYRPDRIDYGGNSIQGMPASASVRFSWQARWTNGGLDIPPRYVAGSVVNTTSLLYNIRVYTGETQVRQYRTRYIASAATNSSLLSGVAECSPAGSCPPEQDISFSWTDPGAPGPNTNKWAAATMKIANFGSGDTALGGYAWTVECPGARYGDRFAADLGGDGRADLVGFPMAVTMGEWGCNGVVNATAYSTSTGNSFAAIADGGLTVAMTDPFNGGPTLGDIDGDGRPDLVFHTADGVLQRALNTGSGFAAYAPAGGYLGADFPATDAPGHPKFLVDLNGDGRADMAMILNDGVYVGLSNGSTFNGSTRWIANFGIDQGYASQGTHPRMLVDMNGDGLPDVVGFKSNGVYVALNTGSGFSAATLWITGFGTSAGWTNMDTFPRTLADVNGDGLPDVVGFKNDGVYVAINTGVGLLPATRWITDFGTATATAYASQSVKPRYVVDVNGDGMADIVGFAAGGVQVALSTGTAFNPSSQWVAGFGTSAGYVNNTINPRLLADVDGDGLPDVVGFATTGTYVAYANPRILPDRIVGIDPTTGNNIQIAYKPLTDTTVYTKGTGAAYPAQDLQGPLYVASSVQTSKGFGTHGTGGYLTTNYKYGQLRNDVRGRMLGFGWREATSADTNITVRTDYRQDWPYAGLPSQVKKTLPGSGSAGKLAQTNHTYQCLNPATGTACTVAAGNRYFPYIQQSVETGWDLNGAALPTVTTTNQFDQYGNATQVAVAASDGQSKTTTNVYQNDTGNWFLGRLVRSQVTSTAP